jgi:hypothetical protein
MRAVEARLIYSSKTTGAFLVQEVWGIFDDLQPLFNRIFCKEIAQGPFGGCFVLFTKFFVELSTISTLSTYTCSNVGTWRTIHTVVFALIVTGPSSERVCVRGGACFGPPLVGGFGVGGGLVPPPPPLACSVTIYAKTTVLCSPDSSMPTVLFSFMHTA